MKQKVTISNSPAGPVTVGGGTRVGGLRITRPPTLALVAHDRCKEMLASFVLEHRAELSRFHLVATQGTGTLVQRRTGLKVHLLEPRAAGANRLSDLVEANELHAVIFLRDPLSAQAHEPDVLPLLDACDLRDIPVATNRASAEALVYFLLNSPNRGVVMARPWGLSAYAQQP